MNVNELVVTISAADPETGEVVCRDNLGNEFSVNGSLRPKGAGFPAPEERWVIRRTGSAWMLGTQIGAAPVPRVEGSRDGLHPVISQVLDALATHGLVLDTTTDIMAPSEITAAEDPGMDPDDQEIVLVPDDPDVVPVKDNGPEPIVVNHDEHPELAPLVLGTYDLNPAVGPQRATYDLTRLSQSQAQVFGLQGVGDPSRDALCSRLGQQGWDYYRPTTVAPDSTIFWREDQFEQLDQGAEVLSVAGENPGPSSRAQKTLTWVHLRQKVSSRDFYLLSTRLHPHIEGHNHWHTPPYSPGRPSEDPELAQSMADTYAALATLTDRMQSLGSTTPVFTVGNWNIDFFSDQRVRDPRFPYSRFRGVETYSNFDLISHTPRYGTHGKRYADSIWVTRPQAHQVAMIDHWILTGYHSTHRPVIAKATIRSKSGP